MNKDSIVEIYLNVHGKEFLVKIFEKEHFADLIHKVQFEFASFVVDKSNLVIPFQIEIKKSSKDYLKSIIPRGLKPTFQRENSITYDAKKTRWNNYYEKVVTEFSPETNLCQFFIFDVAKGFEVLYLFLNSLSGKYLDLKGTHKVHAFAIEKDQKGLVCMMPMKGGKSTLFMELLKTKDQGLKFYSDDAPLITKDLELKGNPTPIHLISGEENPFPYPKISFLREAYGSKDSIQLPSEKRGTPTKFFILAEARRSTFAKPVIERGNFFDAMKALTTHALIGVGLPIIFEYFWMKSYEDFFLRTKIFFLRFSVIFRLALGSKFYKIYLCDNASENAKAIENLLRDG